MTANEEGTEATNGNCRVQTAVSRILGSLSTRTGLTQMRQTCLDTPSRPSFAGKGESYFLGLLVMPSAFLWDCLGGVGDELRFMWDCLGAAGDD